MFQGFNIAYPEYEVITPQTKRSYHVRSLSVQEEEKLKASLLTPSKERLTISLYNWIGMLELSIVQSSKTILINADKGIQTWFTELK